MGNIQTINSIKELNLTKLSINPNSLILLDIDNTIITPKANIFRNHPGCYPLLIDELKEQRASHPNINDIVMKWRLKRKVKLVESGWIELINNLKQSHATITGLTQLDNCLLNDELSIEKWRYNELKELGIEFSDYNGKYNKILCPITTSYSMPASVYNGIIITGKYSKRQALTAYIEHLKEFNNIEQFEQIIFIDDRLEKLEEIAEFAADNNIKFYGYHYKAAELLQPINLSTELIEKQKMKLLTEHIWLEDDELTN